MPSSQRFTPVTPATPAEPSDSSLKALLERLTTPERLKGMRDAQGRSLLMAAIEDDDVEMVRFLAPRSDLLEPIKMIKDTHALTPLMLAAQLGREACVQALLEHQPHEQCAQGGQDIAWPAVDQAVEQGHGGCVALLAPFSNLKNRRSMHPMTRAGYECRLDLIQVLLPFAPLNARDKYLNNVLGAVVCSNTTGLKSQREDCVLFLLQQPGLQVVLPGTDGIDNPLHKVLFDAIRHDYANIVQMLLPYFELNALKGDHFGGSWKGRRTALHVAVTHNAVECFNMLLPLSEEALTLRQNAAWNANKDEQNTTPIELALAQLARSSGREWHQKVKIADALVAYNLHCERPTPMPNFMDKYKDPLSDEDKRTYWPQTCSVLEAKALRATLEDVPVEEHRPVRARL